MRQCASLRLAPPAGFRRRVVMPPAHFHRPATPHHAMIRTTACLLLGAALAAADPTPVPAAPLRVMSFNIRYGTADDKENHWNQRKDLVATTILAYDPDLLGTQETLHFQGEFLATRLPTHTAFGVGRDDGAKLGEATMVYFRTARFEKLDGGHFWLSETPDKPGVKGWDADCPRMVTWLKLRDRQAEGRELLWLNTHWDHKGRQARLESARQIRRWLEPRAANLPVVITGDFNCTEGSEPYTTLMGKETAPPGLLDAFRVVHPQRQPDEASSHRFDGNRRGSRIDWILCSPHFKPTAATIDHSQRDGRYPSDHYPVTATLEPAPGGDR